MTSGKPGGGNRFEDELPVHIEDRSRVVIEDSAGQQLEIQVGDAPVVEQKPE